jgi:hypothetical protein
MDALPWKNLPQLKARRQKRGNHSSGVAVAAPTRTAPAKKANDPGRFLDGSRTVRASAPQTADLFIAIPGQSERDAGKFFWTLARTRCINSDPLEG